MPIDPANVTPGVWELIKDDSILFAVVFAKDGHDWCRIPYRATATVDAWTRQGWQFTARYVACEGEPQTCPQCRGNGRVEMLEHCPTCKGLGRVWIVPLTKEEENARD